jgi:hypothetical protein
MNMSVRIIKRVLVILILLSLFSACGELDTVLPSSGTYQVKALINDTSLDDCSLINANETIRPYFASAVTNDPDIAGLTVFLRDSQGGILGGKILYSLKPDLNNIEDFEIVIDTQNDRKNEDSTQKPAQGDASGENPVVAEEPARLRIGAANTLIITKRLDKNLLDFFMPENLDIGQYTLVFQILGEKETLYETEKSIYYLGKAQFSLKEIQLYLPGASTGPRLVQPGATIMLEARLDFAPQLDPYIAWYDGKKLISEGSLSSGAGTILWKAPDQTGFHSLRAEVFPSKSLQGIAGSSREISIPISSKAVSANLVSGDAQDLLHWYQFGGNIQDSKPPAPAEWALIPQGEKQPLWIPAAYNYGLAAGSDNVYQLPPVLFFRKGEKEGGGQLLFRLKPVSEGGIFSALFASTGSTEALVMNLGLNGENLTLSLGVPGAPAEAISVPVDPVSSENITVVINFSILANRFEAVLSLAPSVESENQDSVVYTDTGIQSYVTGIGLAAPLNGECRVSLGAGGEETLAATTAIWDELVIRYWEPALAQDVSVLSVTAAISPSGEQGVNSL